MCNKKFFRDRLLGLRKFTITIMLPQVSILGPLLFIGYINDLPNCLENSSAFIYADYMAILVRGHDINETNHTLCTEVDHVCKCFDADRLSVKNAKTNTMLYCGSQSRIKYNEIKVSTSHEITFSWNN